MVQQIIRDNIIIGRSEHKRSMLLVDNPGMLVNMEGKKWPHFLEPREEHSSPDFRDQR
jgi:hypothetical protein